MEVFLIWLVSIVVGVMIGSRKGAGFSSFILCVLLGPLGVIIVAVSSGDRSPCKFCKELVKRHALVCPHCQRDLKA